MRLMTLAKAKALPVTTVARPSPPCAMFSPVEAVEVEKLATSASLVEVARMVDELVTA